MIQPNEQEDKWEIYMYTSKMINGLNTTPVRPIIRIPGAVKDYIDDFVIAALHRVLSDDRYDDDGNADGIQALEIFANRLFEKTVKGSKLRIELYPGDHGLCIVINLMYDPTKPVVKSDIIKKEYNNEDTLRRRIAG